MVAEKSFFCFDDAVLRQSTRHQEALAFVSEGSSTEAKKNLTLRRYNRSF